MRGESNETLMDDEVSAVREAVMSLCAETTRRRLADVAGTHCRDALLLRNDEWSMPNGRNADDIVWVVVMHWLERQPGRVPSVSLVLHDLMVFCDLRFSRALICLAMKAIVLWCLMCAAPRTHNPLEVVDAILAYDGADTNTNTVNPMFDALYHDIERCRLPGLVVSLSAARLDAAATPAYVSRVFGAVSPELAGVTALVEDRAPWRS